MSWDTIRQIKPTKPTVGKVQMHLFAQPPLGPDAKALSKQQHPDQEFWVNESATSVAVEVSKIGAHAAQIDEPINRPQHVILGNVILKQELVKQRSLCFLPRSHHRPYSRFSRELNLQAAHRSTGDFQRNPPKLAVADLKECIRVRPVAATH